MLVDKSKHSVGNMDRKIQIINVLEVKGSFGESTTSDVNVKEVWASCKMVSGQEDFDEKKRYVVYPLDLITNFSKSVKNQTVTNK